MDTLISKERLIQVLRHTQEEKDCDAITVDALIEYLENECPTAYDLDKVVEELKTEIEMIIPGNHILHGRYIKKYRSIEIVKRRWNK